MNTNGLLHPVTDIIGDVTDFVMRIEQSLQVLGIDVSHLELDHICYRTATEDAWNTACSHMSQLGTLLSDAVIAGRPIHTYRLHTPIRVNSRAIHLVELPAPKGRSPYPTGLEHAEFVVDQSLEAFLREHPGILFDTKTIKKSINRDVKLILEPGITVKFHEQSLADVIRLEQSPFA